MALPKSISKLQEIAGIATDTKKTSTQKAQEIKAVRTSTSQSQPVQVVRVPYMGSYSPETGIVGPKKTEGIKPIPEKEKSFVEPAHAGGTVLTKSEYYTELYNVNQNIQGVTQAKYDLQQTGQSAIDFNPDVPVEIEGTSYPGRDIQYTVSNYNPLFMLGAFGSSNIVEKMYTNKEKALSASQYDKYMENMGGYFLRESNRINQDELVEISNKINKQMNDISDWHPNTKIIKYDPFYYIINPNTNKLVKGQTEGVTSPGSTNYFYDFPFQGAEKYYTYKKALQDDPGRAAALGWGWGGLGNVDIAYYRATGQEEKIYEANIPRLASYMSAKESLAKGDVGGFSGQYWLGYLSMPSTQIGFAYGTGSVVGSLSKSFQASGIVAKTIGGQLAVRGIKIGVGSAIVGYSAYNVAEPVVNRGDWGEGLGRGVLTTASFAAGGIGYQQATGPDFLAEQSVIKANQPTFTKEFIKNVPRITKIVQSKLPGLKPIGYLYGEGIVTKPIYSKSSMGDLLYKSYQHVGSTKFASNIYGWAAKGYVPANTYVLNQQGVSYRNGMRYQDVTWNKISNNRVWIPRETAMRFQSYIGDSDKIQINFPVSRDLSGGNINITGVVEGKSVKFGRNWFSRSYFSSTLEKDIEIWKLTSSVDMTGALGSYKPGGIVDVYKDVGVPKPRYSFFGEMVEKGYTFEKPIIMEAKGGNIQTFGVHGEMYSGFGSRYQPLNIPKSSTQWVKNISSGIVKNVEASMDLSLRTESIYTIPKSFSSMSSNNFMYVPIQSISSSFYPYVIPNIYSSNISTKTYDVFSINVKQPIYTQIKQPVTTQIKSPIYDSWDKSISRLGFINIFSPINETKQDYLINVRLDIPLVTRQEKILKSYSYDFKPVIPKTISGFDFPPIVPFLPSRKFHLGGGGGSLSNWLGKGYRYRKWKVPKLSDFLGGR